MSDRRDAWRLAVDDFAYSAKNNPMAVHYLGGPFSPTLVQRYYAFRQDGDAVFGTPEPTPEQAVQMARDVEQALTKLRRDDYT